MTFKELNLSPVLLQALQELDYKAPSAIQEQAIPPALEGRDVLGCAQTGTGKTAAFSLPILQNLMSPRKTHTKKQHIRSLILTPTRELAIQIADSFSDYGKYSSLKTTVVFGGVSAIPQIQQIKKGVDILIATPGRLMDLVNQEIIDLKYIEIFVLDEADRMLDMGFVHDVKKILTYLPKVKQTLFFSATMPTEIQSLVSQLLVNPAKVSVTPASSTVDIIKQSLYYVDRENKRKLLVNIIKKESFSSILVFSRTKHGADRIAKDLVKANILASAIHGDKSQGARQTALSNFKAGKIQVLVATDIAARGIDIEELACVINFNMPNVPETYVHRIGRTGRAGLGGIAISFSDIEEKPYINDIQKLIKKKIPVIADHPFPMEIFEVIPKEPRPPRVKTKDNKSKDIKTKDSKAKASHSKTATSKVSNSKNDRYQDSKSRNSNTRNSKSKDNDTLESGKFTINQRGVAIPVSKKTIFSKNTTTKRNK